MMTESGDRQCRRDKTAKHGFKNLICCSVLTGYRWRSCSEGAELFTC